nr:retrovirus-related Pol polyprotein from transposon TNT 1-94 [Tanacetum cinerariifolium]
MQIEDYLYQKKLYEPLAEAKPTGMKTEDWALLDRQALGAVMLSLAKNVAYNVVNEKTTYGLFSYPFIRFYKYFYKTFGTMFNLSNNAKFPYLKKDEYETWAMKMEYWIMNIDHNLWKIIQNGNNKKSLGRDSKGGIIILPPVSFEEHVVVQRETKARTLLLQSLPEDHMADFHHLDEKKVCTKAMIVALTLKTRGGFEYLSFDDLYNKLRSLKIDVKGGSSYGSRSTTVVPTHSAFIGAAGTNTKMVYSDQPSYSSSITYTSAPLSSIMEDLGHFVRECNVKKVDEKARYYAFKISKTEEAEQVYGLMAGFESDFAVHAGNAAGSVNPAAAEFAMMGISPKAKIEKQEWDVKFIESLARFDKWEESSKNLAKLLYSFMSTRTKLGLGFKEYIGSDEVCDLSTPSVFNPEHENREVKSLYERFVKAVTSPQHEKLMTLHLVFQVPRPITLSLLPIKSHLIKDCDVYDTVDNFPSVVSEASSVPAGSRNSSTSTSAGRSIPAASRNRPASIHVGRSIPAVFTTAHAASSTLPPALNVAVDPIATKRVNTIHPQSQIIRELQSLVQTRSTVQKSKFSESAFISYVHNQNRTNHTDHLHCLFSYFLSQLEYSSVAKSLADPDWVAAMQEEMQQFYNQQVYVDDIIFGSTNQAWCDEFKVLIKGEFEMSDMAFRPDIMFVVSACSRHQVTPMSSHLNAVKKIFKYLKGQPNLGRPPILLVVPVFLLVVLVHADGWVSAGRCTIPTGSCTIPTGSCTFPTGGYLFMLLDWFLLDDHNKVAYLEKGKGWEAYEQILDFLNRSHIRPFEIIATIDGNEVVVSESLIRTHLQLNDTKGLYEFTLHDVLDGMREIWYPTYGSLTFYKAKLSPQWRFLIHTLIHYPYPRPTFDFTAKLFSNMKLNWDGPHMPLLAPMLVVPAGGDGADAVAAGAAAAHDVPPPPPPPIVPPTHSSSFTPGPSTATQATPVREPTPVKEPTPVREPTPMREPIPSPVREPTFFQEPTPDSPRPPSLPPFPRSEEVGPTTSTRPPTATAGGRAEDSTALTNLSLKLDKCITRVTTLENELDVTKKVLGGDEAATKEQDIDLDALHKLASTSLGGDSTVEATYTIYKASQGAHASSDTGHDAAEVPDDTTMPFRRTSTTRRRLRKPFTSSASEHFPKNIFAVEDTLPAGEGIPAGSTTIPAGSSMDPAVQAAAAAPSSTIPAADKGKAPMDIDDSLPADLLSEQERILKNLHDYQLGGDLAKKLHTEQEAEFARQQEELAQKAQAESAYWLELMAKIATNSALSKQLLGDDVNEENMNERLGMLLMRKRRELAEQSRVKPMNKTQQREYMQDFVKNQSASVYNQGWTMKQVKALSLAQLKHEFEYIQWTLERSNLLNFKRTTFRLAPSLEAPSAKRARQEVPLDVHTASSQVPAGVSATPSTDAAVSVSAAPSIPADESVSAALSIPADELVFAAPSVPADTKVHADESRLDDPQTDSEHVFTEPTVDETTPSSSRTRRKHLAKKRVTPIVNIDDDALIKFDSASDDDPLPYAPYVGWEMVPSLLGSIHAYYDMEGHTKHFTSLRELLHMVEKNDLWKLLGVVDDLSHREEPDTFALLFWGDFDVHVLETMDGWVIYMFVDVSYPLSAATLTRMLKHGLEVPKLLVGEDLTIVKQLVTQNWMVITFYVPVWNDNWLVQGGTALELASPEQKATGKDVSNPFMAVMVCQKPLGYFSSPMIHVPRAGLVINLPGPDAAVPCSCCLWCSCCLFLLWKKAINEEMVSLEKNQTWSLVRLPAGKKALQSKWVFRVKEEQDDKKRYKARLVVKGFQKKKGVNYNEIFSSVVKMTTIRFVLSIVAIENLHLEQSDVKTSFLDGDLDEDIYMTQPRVFSQLGKKKTSCREGYKRYAMDHCCYLKKVSLSSIIELLYVDDMLVEGSNMAEIKKLKRQLSQEFKMKDLGKVLEKFNIKDAKARCQPLGDHFKLSKKQAPNTDSFRRRMAKVLYASVVDNVMYTMVCTRPDIAHTVGVVSRFMSNPGREHWEAVKWLLRYLKGTSKATLCFSRKEVVLEGFSDSDYGGCLDSGKSTTEAEYMAIAKAGKELVWLKNFFEELDRAQTERVLLCDNQSAIRLMKNLKILGAKNPTNMLTKVVIIEKLKLYAALMATKIPDERRLVSYQRERLFPV